MKFWCNKVKKKKNARRGISFMKRLSVRLVLEEVGAFQGRACFNSHLLSRLCLWGFEMFRFFMPFWLAGPLCCNVCASQSAACLFCIQKRSLSTKSFATVVLFLNFWLDSICSPDQLHSDVHHRLSHWRSNWIFWTRCSLYARAVYVVLMHLARKVEQQQWWRGGWWCWWHHPESMPR